MLVVDDDVDLHKTCREAYRPLRLRGVCRWSIGLLRRSSGKNCDRSQADADQEDQVKTRN